MKRLVLSMIVGIMVFGMLSWGDAQQGTGLGATSPVAALSAAACRAIQQYIARIDAARSMSEPVKRQETYDQAEKDLQSILRSQNLSELLGFASEYAKLTEVVVKTDSTDPRLAELLDRRLTLRRKLLDHCDD